MASINPPACNFGWKAPEFNLPDVNGKLVNLQESMGPKGLLVMFICNHCPYVKAILPRLIKDLEELKTLGVNTVAIMSNDPSDYPEDSPENMKKIAEELAFPFPYLLDETQQIAKNYDAVCTPDFFGFNKNFELQYRGRFDESRKETAPESTRDLFRAMKQVSQTGHGPKQQVQSIGCSIKWKE
ncbi:MULTISPECIES: thioredoxin family protein [unclassified Methylophilus]|uniref:thioredoxin family protein n=1 Tax=unclassified Methylophilus TaxID=2630143 RepID=UPI000700FB5F|nr:MULTISPECIES: thioredoxin family protein [unclassified Methylophilus]KQT42347.1 alkyl hydroperoxide reductase [Methylophilus sp. Leaf416]KQT56529.1 alkyl hydroperoxide reductase [Methylophilus sp. Leaf459]